MKKVGDERMLDNYVARPSQIVRVDHRHLAVRLPVLEQAKKEQTGANTAKNEWLKEWTCQEIERCSTPAHETAT